LASLALDLLHNSLIIVHSADVLLECMVPDWASEAMDNGHGAKRYKIGGYRWFLGGNDDAGTEMALETDGIGKAVGEELGARGIEPVMAVDE
jgi:hypothetical protein